jgi:serine/threonine protein kinase
MTLKPSDVLANRYQIIQLLGQGGFGAVYRGWDMNLQKSCAVKENLEISEEHASQFMREATTLANLSHPNLPRVIDHFLLPELGQYLVMDFVEGENLEAKVSRGGPVPYHQAIFWIGQIADALNYLHNQPQPLIHRDIKPANIIITPAGQAMLVDFGLVKVYESHVRTVKGARGITPGYSPPEQYGIGKTDARTDIYALAATLFTLLTGAVPPQSVDVLSGSEPAPKAAHLLNPQVPASVSAVIQAAMQMDTNKRYPTANAFKIALFAAIPNPERGEATVRAEQAPAIVQVQPAAQAYGNARPPSSPQKTPTNPPKTPTNPPKTPTGPVSRPVMAVFGIGGCVIAAVVVALLAVGGWLLFGNRNATPAATTPTSPPRPTQTTVIVAPVPTHTAIVPTDTPLPQPTDIPQLTPLPNFSDDFSDPSSGWDRVNTQEIVTDYQDGYYRIFLQNTSTDAWANPNLSAADSVVEVDATWGSGPYNNDFGIICRYQDNRNFYFGAISSDGYAGIFYMQDGGYNILGAEVMMPYDAIYQGESLNHLRFDCVGAALTLYVNGEQLIAVRDTALSRGDVGLIAGTWDEGGVEIFFDNFLMYLR